MQYEVKNAPLPVLICKLDPNESIECQKGAMSWMTPTMQMQTGLGSGAGGLLGALGKMAKSAVTGESIFRNTYIAKGGAGEIAFASSFPGDIICFDTSANPIVAQKSSYLANTMGVNMEIFFQKKLGAGFSAARASLCRSSAATALYSLRSTEACANTHWQQISPCLSTQATLQLWKQPAP